MRILFVSNTVPPNAFGGYEIYLAKVMDAFGRTGWDTETLSGVGQWGDDALAWHNRHLSPQPNRVLRRRVRIDFQTVRRTIARFEPDLISVWNLGGLAPSVFDAVAESNVPYTIHVGDLWPVHFFDGADERYDNVLYNSRYTQTECEKGALRPRSTLVSYLGTDMTPASDACGPRHRMIFAGRICHQKGLHTLVAALDSVPDATLTVAGPVEDKSYMEKITHLIETEELHGRVEFLGSVPYERMPNLLARHGTLILPSEAGESFGLVLIEAMRCGLLAVTSGVGGTREIVLDRVNGLLFEPGSRSSLSGVLQAIGRDAATTERLAHAGRHTVQERFTFERSFDDIRRFLESAIGKGQHAAI